MAGDGDSDSTSFGVVQGGDENGGVTVVDITTVLVDVSGGVCSTALLGTHNV